MKRSFLPWLCRGPTGASRRSLSRSGSIALSLWLRISLLVLAAASLLWASATDGREARARCADAGIVEGGPECPSVYPARSYVTVASLNLARRTERVVVVEELRRLRFQQEVDVLLLQEVERPPCRGDGIATDIARAFGLHFVYAAADRMDSGGMHGLATLSRYPLADAELVAVPQFDLRFRKRCRIALSATAVTSIGPVRTFNLHLDSRINSSERTAQLAPVLDSAGRYNTCLIGGDFNTADVRWFRRWLPLPYCARQTRAVNQLLESAGFSTPFHSAGPTFKFLGLKLDWIYLRGFRAIDSGVAPIRFSDHHAIWVRFEPASSLTSE